MFKPNKQLREILVACVKPECLQQVTERIIEEVMVYGDNEITIHCEDTVTGYVIMLYLTPTNFDEVIECGVWYPREKFDGNPCDHILLEVNAQGYGNSFPFQTAMLMDTTVKFMYIKKP